MSEWTSTWMYHLQKSQSKKNVMTVAPITAHTMHRKRTILQFETVAALNALFARKCSPVTSTSTVTWSPTRVPSLTSAICAKNTSVATSTCSATCWYTQAKSLFTAICVPKSLTAMNIWRGTNWCTLRRSFKKMRWLLRRFIRATFVRRLLIGVIAWRSTNLDI